MDHRSDSPAPEPRPRRARWRTTLATWLLAALLPLALLGGFAVGVDATGYFGLNRFGAFEGDELVIKQSMMRHYPHDALLLGDSRAAFTDPSGVPGLSFFNAAAGGGSPADAQALLERHDLEGVELVVLLLPYGLGDCAPSDARLRTDWGWVRNALTYEALARSLRYVAGRLRGELPNQRADGTRFPDSRVAVPFDWDGTRDERYLEGLEDRRDLPPLDQDVALAETCVTLLEDMRAYARARGAELVWVLAPVNEDVLRVTGTDPERLRQAIEQEITSRLGFALDYTVSRFSDRGNFGPRDPVHFLPERGGALLRSAIEAFRSRQAG